MRKRTFVWVGVALLVAATVALFIPGSPIYLTSILGADGLTVDGHSLSHWKSELTNPDPKSRQQAAKAIGTIGSNAGVAVPDVARLLTDDAEEDVRIAASVALVKMAPHTKTVVPELARALTDPNLQVRQNAINALGRLRTDARAAVPALIEAMRNPENDTNARLFLHTIQEGAASILGFVSAGTPDAVPALTDVLTGDASDHLKAAAARSLGLIGPPARPAVPTLYAMLSHKDRYIREESNIALRALGEKIEPFQLTEEDKKQGRVMKDKGDGKNSKKGGSKDRQSKSP